MHDIKAKMRSGSLHTVCESAKCPNLGECFGRGTATFMILGDRCTRNCGFCAVEHEKNPLPPDPEEPSRVAEMVDRLGLKYAVITSVTRDDLQDGGAEHFADVVNAIRATRRVIARMRNYVIASPKGVAISHVQLNTGDCRVPATTTLAGPRNDTRIEILTPDFNGSETAIKTVLDASPDVFNHNLETVERLTPLVRNRAEYQRSLKVLRFAKSYRKDIATKSGLMVGLGETNDEIRQALNDIKDAGVDFVTIGQYLRPSKNHLEVARYVTPEEFDSFAEHGESIGLKKVFAGPLVRSSYMAEETFNTTTPA